MPEHALIVHFPLSGETAGGLLKEKNPIKPGDDIRTPVERHIDELSIALEKQITEAGVGEYNGPEIEAGELVFYLFGPDADALFETVERTLRESPLSGNGWAIKHFGTCDDPEHREEVVRFV